MFMVTMRVSFRASNLKAACKREALRFARVDSRASLPRSASQAAVSRFQQRAARRIRTRGVSADRIRTAQRGDETCA